MQEMVTKLADAIAGSRFMLLAYMKCNKAANLGGRYTPLSAEPYPLLGEYLGRQIVKLLAVDLRNGSLPVNVT
jgi:hypothetical protein